MCTRGRQLPRSAASERVTRNYRYLWTSRAPPRSSVTAFVFRATATVSGAYLHMKSQKKSECVSIMSLLHCVLPLIVWIMGLGMYSQLLRSPCCLQLVTNAKSLTFKCPIKHDGGLCDAQQPYRPRVKALWQLPHQPLIWLQGCSVVWHLSFDTSIFHYSGWVGNSVE